MISISLKAKTKSSSNGSAVWPSRRVPLFLSAAKHALKSSRRSIDILFAIIAFFTDHLQAGLTDATIRRSHAYFGIALEQTLDAGELIPALVRQSCEHIENVALSSEGIFRLSGKQVQIDTYRYLFDVGATPNLTREADPHTVAGVLKLFLRELPEPLVPRSYYNRCIQAMMQQDEVAKRRVLRHVLHALPRPYFATLRYLCTFLRKVAQRHAVNKMAAHNLATVFAPNLLKVLLHLVNWNSCLVRVTRAIWWPW